MVIVIGIVIENRQRHRRCFGCLGVVAICRMLCGIPSPSLHLFLCLSRQFNEFLSVFLLTDLEIISFAYFLARCSSCSPSSDHSRCCWCCCSHFAGSCYEEKYVYLIWAARHHHFDWLSNEEYPNEGKKLQVCAIVGHVCEAAYRIITKCIEILKKHQENTK